MNIEIPDKEYFKSTLVEIFNRISKGVVEDTRLNYNANLDVISVYSTADGKVIKNIQPKELTDFFKNEDVLSYICEAVL